MTYYAHAKGGVPFYKREEERRWKEHLRRHREAINKSKPSMKYREKPEEYAHIHVKLKRLQQQEDRLSNIEYQNRRLGDKIERVEKRPDKQTWNEKYVSPREKGGNRTHRSQTESSHDESFTESMASASITDDESSDEDTNNSGEDEVEKKNTEDSHEALESTRSKEEDKNEEQEDKEGEEEEEVEEGEKEQEEEEDGKNKQHEENKEEGSDISSESSDDEESEKNKKEENSKNVTYDNSMLEKRLKHLLATMKPEERRPGETEEERLERLKTIEQAQRAVQRENELLNGKRNRSQHPSLVMTHNERVKENQRLNRKIKEIMKGKGRPKRDEPEYNTYDRWWVTSPRGREKVQYEIEKEKLIEKTRKRREQRKVQRTKEDKKIIRMKKEEKKKKQQEVPEGYRKKLTKKAKTSDKKEEELPDTSIIHRDPYENPAPLDSDGGAKDK